MRPIDADLLKQSIPRTKMDEFENCRYCRLLDEEQVKDLIDAMPTADVRENVRGEWIFPYGDKKYKRCSACGKTFYSIPATSNFCPNCGADMRGDQT